MSRKSTDTYSLLLSTSALYDFEARPKSEIELTCINLSGQKKNHFQITCQLRQLNIKLHRNKNYETVTTQQC